MWDFYRGGRRNRLKIEWESIDCYKSAKLPLYITKMKVEAQPHIRNLQFRLSRSWIRYPKLNRCFQGWIGVPRAESVFSELNRCSRRERCCLHCCLHCCLLSGLQDCTRLTVPQLLSTVLLVWHPLTNSTHSVVLWKSQVRGWLCLASRWSENVGL